MPDEISIRRIRQSDVSDFKALRLEALRDHPISFSSDYEENLRRPESFWIDCVKGGIDSPTGCIVLAEAETELAAMAGTFRDNTIKNRHEATVWGVYVRPKYRGQKLTERLIAELLNWSKSNEVRILRLSATCAGSAIRSYLRCGFVAYGISHESIRVGDQYYDEMLMWRRV